MEIIFKASFNWDLDLQSFIFGDMKDKGIRVHAYWRKNIQLPIGQRPIALLDSSKSINIKSISTAATLYLMSTVVMGGTLAPAIFKPEKNLVFFSG